MLTGAGVWPDCRLERHLVCWARQSGVVGRQHEKLLSVDTTYYVFHMILTNNDSVNNINGLAFVMKTDCDL